MKLVCLFVFFAGLCHGASKATECAARGRFPNDDAEHCRGYTMCLLGGAGTFTQYKLTCPVSFTYSHLEQQCTNATNYQCIPSYLCHASGNFENPLSIDCSSYIACPEGINGTASARQVECPSGEVFNPVVQACVNTGYECPVGVTTEVEAPVTESMLQNVTVNVQAVVENGFQLTGSVSVNGAVDVSNKKCSLWFALLLFVNIYH